MTSLPLEQLADFQGTAPVLGMPSASDFRSHIVVVGASAGGLKAISIILASLQADFPAPIVIVQHLSPDFPSQMARILSGLTSLRVIQAEEGDCLQAGHVYLAPPGKHLLINPDLSLSLSVSAKVHYCRPSVDVLFRSVAASCGSRAIGVVLTGGDGDGSVGICAIKMAGGTTIAQDLLSSQHPSMPRHAQETGDIDFVLPLPDIAAALVALVRLSKAPAQEFSSKAETETETEKLKTEADLAVCSEALRTAEEALRVQSDAIASYRSGHSDELGQRRSVLKKAS